MHAYKFVPACSAIEKKQSRVWSKRGWYAGSHLTPSEIVWDCLLYVVCTRRGRGDYDSAEDIIPENQSASNARAEMPALFWLAGRGLRYGLETRGNSSFCTKTGRQECPPYFTRQP